MENLNDMKSNIANKKRNHLKNMNHILEGLHMIRFSFGLVFILLVIMIFLIRPVYVHGDSMHPTLNDGEIGFTNMIDLKLNDIKRFDIVSVYNEDEDKILTKRVIGLPNETLEYKEGKLYIDGVVIEESFLDDEYIKKQTNDGSLLFTSDYGPIILNEDEYFLCGDNRLISKDSRISGPYKKEDIISKYFYSVLK